MALLLFHLISAAMFSWLFHSNVPLRARVAMHRPWMLLCMLTDEYLAVKLCFYWEVICAATRSLDARALMVITLSWLKVTINDKCGRVRRHLMCWISIEQKMRVLSQWVFPRAFLDNCWMLQPSVRNYVFATTDFYNFQLWLDAWFYIYALPILFTDLVVVIHAYSLLQSNHKLLLKLTKEHPELSGK